MRKLRMYENLKKALESNGHEPRDIEKLYLLKIGGVAYYPGQLPEIDSLYPIEQLNNLVSEADEHEQRAAKNYFLEIVESLRKHPNVFELKTTHKMDYRAIRPTRTGYLVDGPVHYARLSIPRQMIEYADIFMNEEELAIDFSVITTGSLFLTYEEIIDYPVYSGAAQEFREILEKQVGKETDFFCNCIGPCPIHPDYYLVIYKGEGEAASGGQKVFGIEDDVFIEVFRNGRETIDIIDEFFWSLRHEIESFYADKLTGKLLYYYDKEISDLFSELADAAKRLIIRKFWRITGIGKTVKKCKTLLADIHIREVEFQSELVRFNRSKKETLNDIKNNKTLSNSYSYFSQMIDPLVNPPDCYFRSIDFFNEEVKTYRTLLIIVIASLVGAIIGALITALLT